jgi:mannitol-1-/sugar-/sorbitol-6-/2-deoxyglucose-6-phosphatase
MNIKDFEAVIFDMDGVLIDSEPLWKIAMEEVFTEVGCPLTKKDFQKTVGLRIDEVISYWFNQIGWEGLSEKEVEEKIIQKMVLLIQQNGSPLTGVIEMLHFLKQEQIKIGLATSSYTILIETVLTALNIQHYFDFTHSAEHEDFGKPHPAVYLSVAKKLNVSPLRCLVIEDSLNGIISGKAARMKVVCIPEKTHQIDPKLGFADHTFSTMKELLNHIQ